MLPVLPVLMSWPLGAPGHRDNSAAAVMCDITSGQMQPACKLVSCLINT